MRLFAEPPSSVEDAFSCACQSLKTAFVAGKVLAFALVGCVRRCLSTVARPERWRGVCGLHL